MPSYNSDLELMDDVQQQLRDRLTELIPLLVQAQLGDDGNAFGDQPLTRGQRIARFMDDASSGALDILVVQSSEIAKQYIADFQRDMRELTKVG